MKSIDEVNLQFDNREEFSVSVPDDFAKRDNVCYAFH